MRKGDANARFGRRRERRNRKPAHPYAGRGGSSRSPGSIRSPSKAERCGEPARRRLSWTLSTQPALREAVLSARPEVVVHEMTALANASDLRHFDRAFAQTNRLRTEGLDHLLAAARESRREKGRRAELLRMAVRPRRGAGQDRRRSVGFDAAAGIRSVRFKPSVISKALSPKRRTFEGVVLRYGAFYGPGSGLFDGSALDQLRRRLFPVIGDGGGWWSFLHLDDAAEATACAIENGAPGIYNIVDDDPAPVRDWLPALATMIGAKPPRHIPRWLARFVAGEHMVVLMTESRAGSNAKARRELGWRPNHASWRQGFAEVLASA